MTIIDQFALDDTDHDWTLRAVCNGADPDLFFVEIGQSNAEAKKLCARCPVREECLDYALRHDIRHGVWGGKSEKDRKTIRKLRTLAAARRAAA